MLKNIEKNRKKGLTGVCLEEESGRPYFFKIKSGRTFRFLNRAIIQSCRMNMVSLKRGNIQGAMEGFVDFSQDPKWLLQKGIQALNSLERVQAHHIDVS